MNKNRRYPVPIILIITLVLIGAATVYAGSINSQEARLVSHIKGATFEYKGDKYKATEYGLNQLEAKLASDEYDLTAEQVDRAIALMYENVDVGVQEGYISPTGEKVDQPTPEKKPQGNKSIFQEKIIGQDPVIKNTGFSFNLIPICLGLLILVVIAIGFIKGERKIYRKLLTVGIMAMVMGLVIGISEPILNLFQLQFEAQTVMGDPTRCFVCDDIDATYPNNGMEYGKISCDEIDLSTPLFFGDTDTIFEKGAGQYSGNQLDTGIPGEGKTIIVGGHDLTYFAPLEYAKEGQIINIKTSYGQFEYKITGTKVAKYDDTSAYGNLKGEQLVLYTCYPMGQVFGARNDRYFVYAEKVSGPVIGKVASNE